MKRFALLFFVLTLVSCGGIKQETKSSGKPTLSITPNEINHVTKFADPGTWNEKIVILSAKTVDGSNESPAGAEVTISWSSNNIKVFDGVTEVVSGSKVTVEGNKNLLIKFFSQSKTTMLEYKESVIFQWSTATATLSVNVNKPQNVSIKLTATPQSISYTAKAQEAEGWITATIRVLLTVNDVPIDDEVFAMVQDSSRMRFIDADGSFSTAQTFKTVQGWCSIPVQFITGKGIEYNSSVEVFYGSHSVSIPFTVSYKKVEAIKTTINPSEVSFVAPAEDTGTWRTAYFTVITTDEDGKPISGVVTVSSSSSYVTVPAQITTGDNGVGNIAIQFYTQSYPSEIRYTAYLMANEAIAKINVSGTPISSTYTLSIYPTAFSYSYTGSDTGTWRTAQFTITLADSLGNPVPNASIDIVSPNTDYTRLYDGNTLKTSPMTVQTNAEGKYFLRLDYYTQADYSVDPPQKITYSGTLVASYRTTVKTLTFEVK